MWSALLIKGHNINFFSSPIHFLIAYMITAAYCNWVAIKVILYTRGIRLMNLWWFCNIRILSKQTLLTKRDLAFIVYKSTEHFWIQTNDIVWCPLSSWVHAFSTFCLKRHLLLYHQTDFNQTSKKVSLFNTHNSK